jgi:hypothetical protein
LCRSEQSSEATIISVTMEPPIEQYNILSEPVKLEPKKSRSVQDSFEKLEIKDYSKEHMQSQDQTVIQNGFIPLFKGEKPLNLDMKSFLGVR